MGRERRSWSADVLQSLAPTLKKTHLPVTLVILKTLGVFDLKQRCAEWSLCDIKVPREW